jgi:hypothetical protein
MSYILHSISTSSYWKYVLGTGDSWKTFLSVLGAVFLVIEILDFYKITTQSERGIVHFVLMLVVCLVIMIYNKRPVDKICYKIQGSDLIVEVRIGDLFEVEGQKVISTNTTFDTDMSNGIIAPQSLQGQFTNRFFPSNQQKLDQDIEDSLNNQGIQSSLVSNAIGKNKKYPIGTIVKLKMCDEIYYWIAMADMNSSGTAKSDPQKINKVLEDLWIYLINAGEKQPIVLPLIGTGRGRVDTESKILIGKIATSFMHASRSHKSVFSNKLIIVVHPNDARNFALNLFEVKDHLAHILR